MIGCCLNFYSKATRKVTTKTNSFISRFWIRLVRCNIVFLPFLHSLLSSLSILFQPFTLSAVTSAAEVVAVVVTVVVAVVGATVAHVHGGHLASTSASAFSASAVSLRSSWRSPARPIARFVTAAVVPTAAPAIIARPRAM